MKSFTKLAAVTMAAIISVTLFTSCSKKKDEGIESDYYGDWDITEEVIKALELNITTDYTDARVIIELTLEFDEGKYCIYGDTEDLLEDIMDFCKDDNIKRQLMFSMGLYSYSDDELDSMAQSCGYDDFDEMWEERLTLDIPVALRDFTMHGSYVIDGTVITFTPNDETREPFECDAGDGTILMELDNEGTIVEFTK